MKILIAGSNVSGSWKIRGEQLGRAINADVESRPKMATGCDIVILVKRPDPAFVANLHSKFKVWDVVDAWPQPVGNGWSRDRAMSWLRDQVKTIRPNAIVAATRKMAEDCEEFGLPTLWLPHHGRPDSPINPIRDEEPGCSDLAPGKLRTIHESHEPGRKQPLVRVISCI